MKEFQTIDLERSVHVFSIDVDADQIADVSLLSEDELERAERFKFEKDRIVFTSARSASRNILGRYLDVSPSTVSFETSKFGKLSVDGSSLHFNISHSHKRILFAITKIGQVGVDIEHNARFAEYADIAKRFFSKAEFAAFSELPDSEHRQAFFNIWTRKEAFIKAVGEGLSFPLDQFEVSIGNKARLLKTYWDETDVMRWSMTGIEVGGEYTAALCVRGRLGDHALRLERGRPHLQ